MELVGWKQPIKKKKEEKKRKDELDFLAGFPAIVVRQIQAGHEFTH